MSFARRASLLSLASVALFMATPSEAEELRGVSEIQVLIESINSDGAQCGIAGLDVKDSVSYPLVLAGLKIIPDSHRHSKVDILYFDPTFYVNINSIYIPSVNLCFSSVEITVYINEDVAIPLYDSGLKELVRVLLWRSGTVLSTGRSEHGRHVLDATDQLAKEFVIAWRADNPLDSDAPQRPKNPTEVDPWEKFRHPASPGNDAPAPAR